jgi:hypothetical protein
MPVKLESPKLGTSKPGPLKGSHIRPHDKLPRPLPHDILSKAPHLIRVAATVVPKVYILPRFAAMQREPTGHRDGIFKSASPLARDGAARQLDEDKIKALRLIDEAPFSYVAILFCLPLSNCDYSWFRFKVCLIAGIEFFTDA